LISRQTGDAVDYANYEAVIAQRFLNRLPIAESKVVRSNP